MYLPTSPWSWNIYGEGQFWYAGGAFPQPPSLTKRWVSERHQISPSSAKGPVPVTPEKNICVVSSAFSGPAESRLGSDKKPPSAGMFYRGLHHIACARKAGGLLSPVGIAYAFLLSQHFLRASPAESHHHFPTRLRRSTTDSAPRCGARGYIASNSGFATPGLLVGFRLAEGKDSFEKDIRPEAGPVFSLGKSTGRADNGHQKIWSSAFVHLHGIFELHHLPPAE